MDQEKVLESGHRPAGPAPPQSLILAPEGKVLSEDEKDELYATLSQVLGTDRAHRLGPTGYSHCSWDMGEAR